LLQQWDLIENDLQDKGIDVASGILAARDARWLRVRIAGLLSIDSRLSRQFRDNQTPTGA
jgi:hypothetical protein